MRVSFQTYLHSHSKEPETGSLSEASTSALYRLSKQQWLWRDCADAQAQHAPEPLQFTYVCLFVLKFNGPINS